MDMRQVYTNTLLELAEKDENIVVVEADLMSATGTKPFKEKYPERFFNVGVAEANMVGISAGLAAEGKIPFAASFGCFAARRTYDQFFLSANYGRLNVKLVGTDPGITAQYNGGTHMPFEDAGIMRNIPGLVICEPCDTVSLAGLIPQLAYHQGPTYLRLHRKGSVTIYPEKEEFKLGKGKVLRDGSDLTLLATGLVMVPEAMKAAETLAKEGVEAAVIDLHTFKPIDADLILEYARKTGAVISCENHNIINGLGSAVAEVLIENHPVPMKRIGVNDEFGEVGTLEYLQERYRLHAANIVETAKELLKRK